MASSELQVIVSLKNEMTQGMSSVVSSLKQIESEVQKATQTVGGFGTGATRNFDLIGSALGFVKSSVKEATIAFASLAGAAYAVDRLMTSYAEFSTAIARAGANAQSSAEEQEQMGKVAREAARGTGVSATEAADALFFMVGGAVKASDAMGVLAQTIDFARANQVDLRSATLLTSQVMQVFKIRGDEVTGVLDVITRAGQISYATTQQLADAFQEAAPIAAQLGMDYRDLTAMISGLADAGKVGGEAGVALKRAFSELVSPSKQARDALGVLGLSVSDVQKLLPTPIELLKKLERQMLDIHDPVLRAGIMTKLFGEISGPAMAALLQMGSEALDGYRTNLDSAGGAVDDVTKRINDARSPTQILKDTIGGLAATIAKEIKPQVQEFSDRLTEQVAAFMNNKEALDDLKDAFGLFLSVLGAVLEAVVKVAEGVGRLQQWFKDHADLINNVVIPAVNSLIIALSTLYVVQKAVATFTAINTFLVGLGAMAMASAGKVTLLSLALQKLQIDIAAAGAVGATSGSFGLGGLVAGTSVTGIGAVVAVAAAGTYWFAQENKKVQQLIDERRKTVSETQDMQLQAAKQAGEEMQKYDATNNAKLIELAHAKAAVLTLIAKGETGASLASAKDRLKIAQNAAQGEIEIYNKAQSEIQSKLQKTLNILKQPLGFVDVGKLASNLKISGGGTSDKEVENYLAGLGGSAAEKAGEKRTKMLDDLASKYLDFTGKSQEALIELNEAHKKLLGDGGDNVGELGMKLGKLKGEYANTAFEGKMAIKTLKEENKKNLADIAVSIGDVERKMSDLNAEFARGQAGDIKSLAEAFVAADQKLAALRDSLRTETDVNRIQEIKAQIAVEEAGIARTAETRQQYAADIEAATKKANLSELEQAIIDFQDKRALAQAEFNEKMRQVAAERQALYDKQSLEQAIGAARVAQAQAEWDGKLAKINFERTEVEKQVTEEKALFEEKTKFINDAIKAAEQLRRDESAATFGLVQSNVQKEIDLYTALAEAIQRARSMQTAAAVSNINMPTKAVPGVTYKSVKDAILRPDGSVVTTDPQDYIIATKNPGAYGGGSIVVNINGGTYLSRDVAERIGDLIIDRLKSNVRI